MSFSLTGRGGVRQVKSLPQRFCTALHRSSVCFLSSSSVMSCPRHNRESAIFHTPIIGHHHLARTSVSLTPPLMTDFTPELRHHILMEYLPHSHDHSFAALAQCNDPWPRRFTLCPLVRRRRIQRCTMMTVFAICDLVKSSGMARR